MMETIRKIRKTFLHVFGFVLVLICASNFFSVDKQTLSNYSSLGYFILVVETASPEELSSTEAARDGRADANTGDARVDANTGGVRVDANTGDVRVDANTGDAKADATTGDAKADATTGDARADANTGDASTIVNFNVTSEAVEPLDDEDIFAADVDCSAVEPYNESMLYGLSYENKNAVSFKPQLISEGPFKNIGFTKVGFAFGIRIVASETIPDEDLERAVKIVAKYIDNDENGEPDYPEALREIQKYNVVVGFLKDNDESETLWVSKFRDNKHEDFRKVFFCHIHFFEQWLSDSNKEFHVVSSADQCETVERQSFDWPLWYFLFTITYYGYLESFSDEQNSIIKKAMEIAKKDDNFSGNYPEDEEMERADFFAWALLMKFGALQCHCDAEVIKDVWKLCSAEANLKKLGAEFPKFLDELQGMPKIVPDGNYSSPAVI